MRTYYYPVFACFEPRWPGKSNVHSWQSERSSTIMRSLASLKRLLAGRAVSNFDSQTQKMPTTKYAPQLSHVRTVQQTFNAYITVSSSVLYLESSQGPSLIARASQNVSEAPWRPEQKLGRIPYRESIPCCRIPQHLTACK